MHRLKIDRVGSYLFKERIAQLKITGEDHFSFIQGLISNDLKTIKENPEKLIFTSHKGKILFETWVIIKDDCIFLFAQQEVIDGLKEHFEFYKILEDVTFSSVEEYSELHYLLSFQEDRLAIAQNAQTVFQKNYFTVFIYDGGEEIDQEQFDAQILDETEFHLIRPIFGLSLFRHDYNNKNLPQEARLDVSVSYTKGCFLGQEPIARLQHKGRLMECLVQIKTTKMLQNGVLYDGNQKITEITSASTIVFEDRYYSFGIAKQKWLNEQFNGETIDCPNEGIIAIEFTDA